MNINSFNKLFSSCYYVWLLEKTKLTMPQIDNIVESELKEFHSHYTFVNVTPEEAVQLRLFYWHNLGTYPWDIQSG